MRKMNEENTKRIKFVANRLGHLLNEVVFLDKNENSSHLGCRLGCHLMG